MCGDQRRTSGILTYQFPSYCPDKASLAEPVHMPVVNTPQRSSWPGPSPHSAMVMGAHMSMLADYSGSADLNAGPHACTVGPFE